MNAPDFDALTASQTKVIENRLRRVAQRYGYVLRKSPRRDERSPDFGLFALFDPRTGGTINPHNTAVNTPYGWTMGDAWAYLMAT